MLCRWLASLPVQLSQLGHRNPALSAQIITSIQAAASRGHKDLLNSLQTCACTIYGMNSIYLIAHFCRDLNHLYLQCLYYFFRNRYFTCTFIYCFCQFSNFFSSISVIYGIISLAFVNYGFQLGVSAVVHTLVISNLAWLRYYSIPHYIPIKIKTLDVELLKPLIQDYL